MAGQQALALLMGVRILLSQPTAPGAILFPGLLAGASGARTPRPTKESALADSQATGEPKSHSGRHPPLPKLDSEESALLRVQSCGEGWGEPHKVILCQTPGPRGWPDL